MKEYNYNRIAEEAAKNVELDFSQIRDEALDVGSIILEKFQEKKKEDSKNGFVIAACVALLLLLGVAVYFNSDMRLCGTYYAFDMMVAGPTYLVLDNDGRANIIYAIDGEEEYCKWRKSGDEIIIENLDQSEDIKTGYVVSMNPIMFTLDGVTFTKQ